MPCMCICTPLRRLQPSNVQISCTTWDGRQEGGCRQAQGAGQEGSRQEAAGARHKGDPGQGERKTPYVMLHAVHMCSAV